MIKVGDEIVNAENLRVLVSAVERGEHGLFAKGAFIVTGNPFSGYLPYELPPVEMIYDWYNWAVREFVTLANGIKLGLVAVSEGLLDIRGYDAKWEHTTEQMREEEQDQLYAIRLVK